MDTFNEIRMQGNLVKLSISFDIKITSVLGWLEMWTYKGPDIARVYYK